LFICRAGIAVILNRKKTLWNIGILISLLIPLSLTVLQIISPAKYLLFGSGIPFSSARRYLSNYTGGIGVSEVVSFMQNKAKNQDIFVGFANNSGNPESAIVVYFEKNPHIIPSYFTLPQSVIDTYECVKTQRPLYFISREDYLNNLNKFLVEEKRIQNPYDRNGFIGIYSLKNNCPKEKTEMITLGLTK
jgi:hypothetical protein